MALCKVYGTIQSGDGNPTVGVYIHAIPTTIPTIVGGVALSSYTIDTISTSTGYFELNLLQDVDFCVIINTLGFKEVVKVPAQAEVVLWTLTSIQETGGTGTDPNW
jgi:hypothetical protein